MISDLEAAKVRMGADLQTLIEHLTRGPKTGAFLNREFGEGSNWHGRIDLARKRGFDIKYNPHRDHYELFGYEKRVPVKSDSYYRTKHWRKKRKQRLQKDKHRCAQCHAEEDLHVHHWTYDDLFNEEDWQLLTFCKTCHKHLHEFQGVQIGFPKTVPVRIKEQMVSNTCECDMCKEEELPF